MKASRLRELAASAERQMRSLADPWFSYDDWDQIVAALKLLANELEDRE